MKYKIKKGLILKRNGKKITIFDPEKSFLFYFNETASYILKIISKGLSDDKIIITLVKEYKLDKTKAKKDLDLYLNELKKYKIII